MAILEKMNGILKTAKILSNTQDKITIFITFKKRMQELKDRNPAIELAKDIKNNMMENIPECSQFCSHQDNAKRQHEYAVKILRKFEKDHNPTEITKGQTWKNFLEGHQYLVTAINNDLRNAWNAHLSSMEQLPSPEEIGDPVLLSPEKRKRLVQYRNDHRAYSDLCKKLPESRIEIDHLKILRSELLKKSSGFESELPQAVIIFLQESNKHDGAELRLLTNEVIEWLKSQNTYKNYRIKKPAYL